MGNYKQISLPSVDVGGYVQYLKNNAKIIRLNAPKAAATETLHATSTDTNYIVPTGKKARVINVVNVDQAGGSTLVYGTTVDSATASTILLNANGNIANIIFVSISVPAGNYITKVANAGDFCTVYIIEEDA